MSDSTPTRPDTARLRELLETATAYGPWRVSPDALCYKIESGDPDGQPVGYLLVAKVQEKADAALIAEARNALPEMLDELATAQKRADEWQEKAEGLGRELRHSQLEATKLREVIFDRKNQPIQRPRLVGDPRSET